MQMQMQRKGKRKVQRQGKVWKGEAELRRRLTAAVVEEFSAGKLLGLALRLERHEERALALGLELKTLARRLRVAVIDAVDLALADVRFVPQAAMETERLPSPTAVGRGAVERSKRLAGTPMTRAATRSAKRKRRRNAAS